MLFTIEIPDDVILEAAAAIVATSDAQIAEREKIQTKREIRFLTSDRPISEIEVKNAASK